jgi:hypothetical protein
MRLGFVACGAVLLAAGYLTACGSAKQAKVYTVTRKLYYVLEDCGPKQTCPGTTVTFDTTTYTTTSPPTAAG